MSDMPETTVSYLRRLLPDVPAIEMHVREALTEDQGRRFSISQAIAKTQKLLGDLLRAERSDEGPQ